MPGHVGTICPVPLWETNGMPFEEEPTMKRTLRAVGLITVCLSWAVSATAVTLAPTKASQVVEVHSGGVTPCSGVSNGVVVDQLDNPDATGSAFTIPLGHVLVVTDVNIQATSGNPGDSYLYSLYRSSSSSVNLVLNVSAVSGANGVADADVSFHHGAVVKSGTVLCGQCFNSNAQAYVALNFCRTIVHGFLARDS